MASPYTSVQSVLEEAGLWQRQLAEETAGSADGSNTIFTVDHKPLADNNYDGTVDQDDVVLYVNGTAATVSSINAITGAITAAVAPALDAEVTADYSYSPVSSAFVAEVIQEAEDWLNVDLEQVITTPITEETPALVRSITRLFAAGLLMSRWYGMQDNADQISAGEAKIRMAEKMLTAYRLRLTANGEDVGAAAVPSTTNAGRLFQRYDTSEGRWDPLLDETFRVNREV